MIKINKLIVAVILISVASSSGLEPEYREFWWYDALYSSDLCVIGKANLQKNAEHEKSFKEEPDGYTVKRIWSLEMSELIDYSVESMSIGKLIIPPSNGDTKSKLGEKSVKFVEKGLDEIGDAPHFSISENEQMIFFLRYEYRKVGPMFRVVGVVKLDKKAEIRILLEKRKKLAKIVIENLDQSISVLPNK